MQKQERKYTYEEVTAYAILATFEFVNNPDMIKMPLHKMVIIMDELENKYSKDLIVDFACKLIEAERNS